MRILPNDIRIQHKTRDVFGIILRSCKDDDRNIMEYRVMWETGPWGWVYDDMIDTVDGYDDFLDKIEDRMK